MTSQVMDLLRESTSQLHTSAEANQFQHQLGRGSVSREDLGAYLQQMYLLHKALAELLDQAKPDDESISTVVQDYHLDLSCLDNDLVFLNKSASEARPLKATAELIDAMRQSVKTRPAVLLGYLYVLEGSTNGAKFIAKALRNGLDLPEDRGASYFDRYGSSQRERWNAFKQAMNELSLTEDERMLLVEAAKKTFDTFTKIGEELTAASSSTDMV